MRLPLGPGGIGCGLPFVSWWSRLDAVFGRANRAQRAGKPDTISLSAAKIAGQKPQQKIGALTHSFACKSHGSCRWPKSVNFSTSSSIDCNLADVCIETECVGTVEYAARKRTQVDQPKIALGDFYPALDVSEHTDITSRRAQNAEEAQRRSNLAGEIVVWSKGRRPCVQGLGQITTMVT